MSDLQFFLDRVQRKYHQKEFLSSDPLEFVTRFTDPWDQEAVALLSAVLAYGNVKQIRRSVEDALGRMNHQPAAFVRSLKDPASVSAAKQKFKSFVHRFNRGGDVVVLFQLLSRSWREHGSLGAHFLSHHSPQAIDVTPALDKLMEVWKSEAKRLRANPSFYYFLTAPVDGSACKRWCMFLRWMGRKDEVDPGLWTAFSPLKSTFPAGTALRADQLVMPLDTHTGRISQYLGLTKRQSLNWLAACEVTTALKACAPKDPTRYDFALARLGILDLCQKRFHVEICQKCDLWPVCHYAQKKKNPH